MSTRLADTVAVLCSLLFDSCFDQFKVISVSYCLSTNKKSNGRTLDNFTLFQLSTLEPKKKGEENEITGDNAGGNSILI